ncbi:MAG: hypothetical protein WC845_00115 [Candidatus Staskawiczbacteria bacterium]|jgi:hypothetical protein
MDSKICGAPWCNKPTAKSIGKEPRHINHVQLCRACYQYIWQRSKEAGKAMKEMFTDNVSAPRRPLPRIKTICAREGCTRILLKNVSTNLLRRIGLLRVCRTCYEAAWELSKKEECSLQEAYSRLKPKGWKPEKPNPVKCCMPWCKDTVTPSGDSEIGERLHACGTCRTYLKVLSRRGMHRHRTWQELGQEAIKGIIPAPGPEQCSMPWCNRIGKCKHRGPNGEPLCNTDAVYVRYYMKSHRVSLATAMQTVPPPRLLHTRKQ